MLDAATPAKVSAPRLTPLNLAIIGVGGHGKKHIESFLKLRDCTISHICDVDTKIGSAAVAHIHKLTGRKPVLTKLIDARRRDELVAAIQAALAQGRCLVAGFHVPSQAQSAPVFAQQLKPLLKPGRHKLIGCATRVQGLMVARGNPLQLRTLADVVATRARFVQRQPGSGTRLLLQHLLQAEAVAADGLCTEAGSAEDSHLAVAAAVASGAADTGLGIEAAATRFGLGFVPLIEEDYYLVCLRDSLDLPAVQKLRHLLQGPAWRELLADVPGYGPGHGGEVLSLTKALPWWRFRAAKRR